MVSNLYVCNNNNKNKIGLFDIAALKLKIYISNIQIMNYGKVDVIVTVPFVGSLISDSTKEQAELNQGSLALGVEKCSECKPLSQRQSSPL